MTTETISLPLQVRRDVALHEADAAARTVSVTWTTGARVRRFNLFTGRTYDEELSLDPAHVNLSRLNAGAPLLNGHSRYDLGDVISVVERAWIEDSRGGAVVRLSERADGEHPLYTAIDWEPMELSAMAIGANAGAGFREHAREPLPCVLIHRAGSALNKEVHMDQQDPVAETRDADLEDNAERRPTVDGAPLGDAALLDAVAGERAHRRHL